MDWQRATPLLEAKLNPANVKPAKSFGPKGDYIEGWHAMAEANRIFGFDGWSYHVKALSCVSERPREIGKDKKPGFGVTYTAQVVVQVDDVTRDDVGAGHGYDLDCGLAHESAIKEAVTDALKRALRSFGNPFGLALYDKSRENVGAPPPPPRDPTEITARIINAIDKAALLPNLQKITFSDAFKETFAWLEAEHPGHAESIRDAQTRAMARIDPAGQAPDERAA